jgi:F-type H+-transporting ATPase subunit alpha
VEILKQAQYSPVSVEKQIAIIYLGTNGLLREVPINAIKEFEELYLTSLSSRYPKVLDNLRAGKLLDEDTATMKALAAELKTQYKS